MSLATILTTVPAFHLVTYLSFQQNTMASTSLPCSSNPAAYYLFVYRDHLPLKSVCHAACRDRAVADSQLLCHQLWLPSCKLPGWAAVHSLASHSCLHYLLRVVSERKCSAGHMRPICHIPCRYILNKCVKTINYAYKQKDFPLGSFL